jgi:hypothetical protein
VQALRGAALAAALVLSACGGGGSAPSSRAGFDAGPPIGRFTCQDWNRAGPALQKATLDKLRRFAGGQITGQGAQGHGAVLSDEDAGRLFHSYCGRRYAQHFLLYKLYTHAAAFIGR